MRTRLDQFRWLALAVMLVAAWFNYQYMIDFTMVMFASPIEDMSHGWIVPLVSLYVLWRQRAEFRAAADRPCWRGAAWVALFLAIAWFGGRGGQSRLEQVSFIGLLWSVPYAFWGRDVERLMRFPSAYLIFTIPVSSFIDFFTIHLRILSSSLATGILNGFGVAVEQSGTALFSRVPGAAFNVDVADPCSGIRSLFAMMALTAAYAFFTQRTPFRKAALFVCSLPIAMIGNMLRIMSICVMAVWFGQDVATGYYHDYSGYVVFVVGILLMIRVGDLLQKHGECIERQLPAFLTGWRRPGSAEPSQAIEPAKHAKALVAVVCLSTVAVFLGHLAMPQPYFNPASPVSSVLPERVGEFTSDVPWFCHNQQCLKVTEEGDLLKKAGGRPAEGFVCPVCGGKLSGTSLGESTDLPKDTVIIKRNYRTPDGFDCSVSVVVGGRNRSSIHRAELCLPAQGFVMLDAGRMPLQLSGGKPLTVRKIVMKREGLSPRCLIYWFLSQERETCSHSQRILLDVWDRSVHNRINRWVMVSINVSSDLESPESKERLVSFLSELYQQIVVDR